jgi:hypothetical protein
MLQQLLLGILLLVTGCVVGYKVGMARAYVYKKTGFLQWVLAIQYMAKRFGVEERQLVRDVLLDAADKVGLTPEQTGVIKEYFKSGKST